MKSLIFKNIWHLAILLLVSCASKKEIAYTAPDDGLLQEELLDTLVITSGANVIDSLPKEFRATKTMEYDILHTKLDLRFDWAKRHVHGVAAVSYTHLDVYKRQPDSYACRTCIYPLGSINF